MLRLFPAVRSVCNLVAIVWSRFGLVWDRSVWIRLGVASKSGLEVCMDSFCLPVSPFGVSAKPFWVRSSNNPGTISQCLRSRQRLTEADHRLRTRVAVCRLPDRSPAQSDQVRRSNLKKLKKLKILENAIIKRTNCNLLNFQLSRPL